MELVSVVLDSAAGKRLPVACVDLSYEPLAMMTQVSADISPNFLHLQAIIEIEACTVRPIEVGGI